MSVIPNPKMTIIFPISCILALIFPIVIKYFPKCEGKGSFLKSQIKSLVRHTIFSSNNFFFLEKNMILCILKGISSFKMHKIIYIFSQKT